MSARIILLNGCSSSGKSSLAKAFQALTPQPFYHVCIDAFEEMMPSFREDDRFDSRVLLEGALKAMYGSIGALAKSGTCMIIDHLLIEKERPENWVSEYLETVRPYPVFNVKVFAPLSLIEDREKNRGDRSEGLAAWQLPRMHCAVRYDLEIDTSIYSPEEAARYLLETLG